MAPVPLSPHSSRCPGQEEAWDRGPEWGKLQAALGEAMSELLLGPMCSVGELRLRLEDCDV